MKRIPPVYSPLPLGAMVSAGFSGAARRAADVADLEGYIRASLAADEVCLTASGTHALQVALRAACGPAPHAHPVAMPAYSCFDLVSAAIGAGTRIRFYDVDPRTLSPDVASLRQTVRSGVSAVVVGNLYGYPVDWASIRDIRAEAGVPVIEDAAQGIGTETPDGRGGTLGDYTILSFGRGKGWTGGGGGAVLRRSAAGNEVEEPRSRLEAHVQGPASNPVGLRGALVTAIAWTLGRPSLYRLPTSIPSLGLGETHYHEPTPPAPIARFSAALARRTARAAIEVVPERRRVARALLEAIDSGGGEDGSSVEPCAPIGGAQGAAFLRLPVRAHSPEVARRLLERGRDLGVAAGYPVALHRLPQARDVMEANDAALAGAEELASRLLTLPTHHWIHAGEIEALRKLLAARS